MKVTKLKRIIIVLLISTLIIPQCKGRTMQAATSTKKEEVLALTKICTNSKVFASNKKVTRKEFAKYLIDCTENGADRKQVSKQQLFSDVKRNSTYSGYINLAVQKGYMTGYSNGTFKPNKTITLKEAITGVLAVLGYTKADFQDGSASARFTLYKELKLNTGISKSEQSKLTTYDLRNLLYNMLNAKNKAGVFFATTLGYEMNDKGVIDYDKLLAKNTKGPIITNTGWEKKLPYALSEFRIYVNGKLDNSCKIQEHSTIYYCKILKKLWVYDKNIAGLYQGATPNALEPQTITVSGQSYTVTNTKEIAKCIAENDIAEGKPAVIIFGKDNKVDRLLPLKAMVAQSNWMTSIPGGVVGYDIYLNGVKSTANDIKVNDAIYYSKEIKTIWAYNKKVNGIIDKILPSIENPETIQIGSKSHTLSRNPIEADKPGSFTTNYWAKILQQKSIKIGTEVVLVYGYDGDVVGIVPVEAMKLAYDGYVLSVGSKVVKDDNTGLVDVHRVMRIVEPSGVERDFQIKDSTNTVRVGDIVHVSFEYGESVVTILTKSKFDFSNEAILKRKLAADVHIIDTDNGGYQCISADQLDGVQLNSSTVLYFTTNTAGEIKELIINNVTGGNYQYGIVKEIIDPLQSSVDLTYTNETYRTVIIYDVAGVEYKLPAGEAVVNYSPGPVRLSVEDNIITFMDSLKTVRIAYLQGRQANDGQSIYKIANDAPTYLLKDTKYYTVNFDDVCNLSDYQLMGYTDNSQGQGGTIRVIVAVKK